MEFSDICNDVDALFLRTVIRMTVAGLLCAGNFIKAFAVIANYIIKTVYKNN